MTAEVQVNLSAHSLNVTKSIQLFGRIENKICNFDLTTIHSIIKLVEDSIQNNHQRQIGFDKAHKTFANRRQSICDEIRKETNYLAGTILPKLYERQDKLVSNR